MLFTLEPLPADEGDCLLLHYGTVDDPKLIVIDGGPNRVFEDILLPRLQEISQSFETPLPIELVMVSHMDSDHIVGVMKLFRRLVREIEAGTPPGERTAKVRRLWHNVFNDIVGDNVDVYYRTLTASLQASIGGEPNPEVTKKLAEAFVARHELDQDEAEFNAEAISAILAGHGEGRSLRTDHETLRGRNEIAALNTPFQTPQGKPTLITTGLAATKVDIEGLPIQVFGPMKAEIDALQAEFDAYIQSKGLNVESVLAAYADESAKNLSSIVCTILSPDEAHSILLTGDARGDKIIAGLKAANLLAAGGTIHFSVLKVPHHGSDRNVTKDFFKTITADHYVFSGDGKNGNPDRATFEWLAEARGKDAEYAIYLTYPVVEIDKQHKRERLAKHKPWDPETHSLQAMFAAMEAQGYRFTLSEGAPVLIDLGDEAVDW